MAAARSSCVGCSWAGRSARDAADATAVAARVTGEMAAEADQERLRIDGQVAAIEHATPGSDQARDAEAALARAERDGDEAVSVALDSDAAEDDVRHREGKGLFHKDADAEGVIRPGIRGGSRPWKRGWSHVTGSTTQKADRSALLTRGEGPGRSARASAPG